MKLSSFFVPYVLQIEFFEILNSSLKWNQTLPFSYICFVPNVRPLCAVSNEPDTF